MAFTQILFDLSRHFRINAIEVNRDDSQDGKYRGKNAEHETNAGHRSSGLSFVRDEPKPRQNDTGKSGTYVIVNRSRDDLRIRFKITHRNGKARTGSSPVKARRKAVRACKGCNEATDGVTGVSIKIVE